MVKNLMILAISLIGLLSCGIPDKPLQSLKSQYSPDSTLVIYQYYYGSAYAWGDGRYGHKIAKIGQEFNADLPDVPGTFIEQWALGKRTNKWELLTVEIDDRKEASSNPITSRLNIGSLSILNQKFRVQEWGSSEYKYDSISQTKDSIKFHGIEMVHGDSAYEKTAFRKGPISIDTEGDSISVIEIRQIIPGAGKAKAYTYRFRPKFNHFENNIVSYGVFTKIKVEKNGSVSYKR